MATEIERKFLVQRDAWRAGAGPGVRYRQGYLATYPHPVVRVRVAGERGFLTIKGRSTGIARAEFEFPIPLADAEEMLGTLCTGPIIEKVRYRVPYAGRTWEVDEFAGANAGLVLAEVELPSADAPVELPSWAGREVSGDPRYYNASLAEHPFSEWGDRP
ncbi:MAG TPA: CYTH domain-containing protein [Gemmatimonadaceae bacterium]